MVEKVAGGLAVGVVIAGAVLTGVSIWRSEARSDRRAADVSNAQSELDAARTEGRAEQVLLFETILPRTIERLTEVREASGAPGRQGAHNGLVAHVLGQIQGFYDAEVRVNYYRLESDENGPKLQIFDKTTSVQRPTLDRTSPEGTLIVNRVMGGDDVYCADLLDASEREIHVRESDRAHKYRCFASVVVRNERRGFGMLSANTPQAAGLPDSSVAFLSVFGAILALSEILVGEVSPLEVGERDVLIG